MTRAPTRMLEFAKGLIALEITGSRTPELRASAAFAVCEKLRPQLSTFLGKVGFSALLSRALVLAADDAAWLRAVHVDANGSLKGSDEPAAPVGAHERLAGGTLLLAHLLGLLVTFIGEELTLRLVREVWPRLPRTLDILAKETRQ